MKLTVGGVEESRALQVRKDPHSGGSEAEIAEQVAFLAAVREDLEAGAGAVRRIEDLRVQLDVLGRFTSDQEVRRAAQALGARLVELEMSLVDLRLTGQGQDGIRFEAKLLQKLGYLAGTLSGADFRPTDQQVEVQKLLNQQVGEHIAALEVVLRTDLGALNTMLRSKGIGVIGDEDR